MRYFLDTEFYEKPGSIELISIGIVSELGEQFYAENAYFDWELHNPDGKYEVEDRGLWDNVHPHVGPPEKRLAPHEIRDKVLEFVGDGPPEFWGYYCDYDWVVFCWLFGRMVDLPKGFPMFCRDLKQEIERLGIKQEELPSQSADEHNALADAWWNKTAWHRIDEIAHTTYPPGHRIPQFAEDIMELIHRDARGPQPAVPSFRVTSGGIVPYVSLDPRKPNGVDIDVTIKGVRFGDYGR